MTEGAEAQGGQSPSADTRSLEGSGARDRASRRRLRPPVQRADLCSRDLILRSLDLARAGKLTIVVGPRGYGKSTALSQWWERLVGQGVAAAWYTASDLDREPDVFLEMIASSLALAGIDMGDAMRARTGDLPAARMLDAILLQLDRMERPVVLVIDDFDRVDHPAVARLVEDMADALPEFVHLVLATRRKPSLAVSVLRTQGVVRIIDPGELRLSNEEMAQALDLALQAPELQAISEQTEGWPVAVQLYRLWRERVGADSWAPRFSGQVDEVADYLAEQVFATLPETAQRLLIDLSPFDFVEPGFADHVRERRDSAALLKQAETELPTLFQRTETGGETAYRLHPLLSDYAQARLNRDPDRAAGLHARAADWLWANQRYAGSVRHRALAGDRKTMVETLGRIDFMSVFLRYGAGELRAILRETPPEVVEALPRLQLMAALAHFKAGHFGEAIVWLSRIRTSTNGFADDPAGYARNLEIEGRALGLLFESYARGVSPRRELEVEAIRRVAADTPLFWGWCENIMIVMHQMRGDLQAARQALARTRDTYRALGVLPFAEQYLTIHDLLIAFSHGDIRTTAELASGSLRRRGGARSVEPTVISIGRMVLGAVDYLRHYREGAADLIRVALDQLGVGDGWFEPYAIAWPVLADVAWRRHGHETVLRINDELRGRLAQQGVLCADDLLSALDAIYLLRAGEVDAAERALSPIELIDGCVPWRARDTVQHARILLHMARNRPEEAAAAAADLARAGETGQRLLTRVKALVLGALAREQAGDPDGADALMAQALHHAFAEEIVGPFVEEGAALAPIARRAVERDGPPLERRHAETVFKALRTRRQYLSPDALNDRETEIMAHLAEGASNKLIARRLGLTENTIKFHLKKIYAKLGVTSRKAAAAKVLEDAA